MKSIEMHFLFVQWEILDGIQRVTMDVCIVLKIWR